MFDQKSALYKQLTHWRCKNLKAFPKVASRAACSREFPVLASGEVGSASALPLMIMMMMIMIKIIITIGGECFCFASGLPDEDKLTYVRDEQCREPCKGDPAFFCGGITAVHIYVASKRKIIENIFLCLLTSLSNWVVPIWGQLLPGGRVVWFATGS